MYATLDRYKRRLAGVYGGIYGSGPEADADAADDLAAAAAEIDGKLAARYVVPLTGATELAAAWQLTLAEELAYGRSAAPEFPGKLKDRSAEVRRQLEAAVAGKLQLPGAAVAAAGGGTATVEAAAPLFTRDQMQGY